MNSAYKALDITLKIWSASLDMKKLISIIDNSLEYILIFICSSIMLVLSLAIILDTILGIVRYILG